MKDRGGLLRRVFTGDDEKVAKRTNHFNNLAGILGAIILVIGIIAGWATHMWGWLHHHPAAPPATTSATTATQARPHAAAGSTASIRNPSSPSTQSGDSGCMNGSVTTPCSASHTTEVVGTPPCAPTSAITAAGGDPTIALLNPSYSILSEKRDGHGLCLLHSATPLVGSIRGVFTSDRQAARRLLWCSDNVASTGNVDCATAHDREFFGLGHSRSCQDSALQYMNTYSVPDTLNVTTLSLRGATVCALSPTGDNQLQSSLYAIGQEAPEFTPR